MLFSRDTSPEARRLLIEILRKKTPAEKLAMVDDLVAMAKDFAMSGLRLRHPSASPEELETRYWELVLGPDTAGRVLEARRSRARPRPLRTAMSNEPVEVVARVAAISIASGFLMS